MHEMSIAQHLIEVILDYARENKATRVTEVHLEIGEMQLIVPDALKLAYEVVCIGTMAHDSELIMTERKIKMECGGCGHTYGAEIGNFICPECHVAKSRTIEGDEILLTSMVCETEESEK